MITIQQQIEETKAAIKPLADHLEALLRRKYHEDSRNFIAANRIALADVETSSGDGKPWFGNVIEFGQWMRANACKRLWAEWNGKIYHASDLMAGRMPDMPGDVSDLMG